MNNNDKTEEIWGTNRPDNCERLVVSKTFGKSLEEHQYISTSHHGIKTRFHLNSCGLHLNDKGATCLTQNFQKFLSDIKFG